MKQSRQLLHLSGVLLLSLWGSMADAQRGTISREPESRCVELIKECVSQTDNARAPCFSRAAFDISCVGSSVGRLAYKRAQAQAYEGVLEDKGRCLGSFDNTWSALLFSKRLSDTQLQSLHEQLEVCTQEDAPELLRP